MPDLSALRARLDALPLDRAPLRRAGLLSLLLVGLLVAGKTLGPDRAARSAATASRQDAPGRAEGVSAAPRPVPSGWTGGRVLAVLLLAAGGGVALVVRRRAAPGAPTGSALDVLSTQTLGPGQTLKLVACGDDVLLLSATAESVRLLRSWPRERFDRDAVSFADVLAAAEPLADPVAEGASPDETPTPDLADVEVAVVPEPSRRPSRSTSGWLEDALSQPAEPLLEGTPAVPPAPPAARWPPAVSVTEEAPTPRPDAPPAGRAAGTPAVWPRRAPRALRQFQADV